VTAPANKPLHGIRAVIIDLDGTMLHTAQDLHIAINRMREDLALAPLDVDAVISFVGKGAGKSCAQIDRRRLHSARCRIAFRAGNAFV
jgi:phosphoglycolate phosphatase-like HAD superfamily hydrolase